MASYQARQRDPLLDQNMQAMLERRGREALGLGLIAVGAIFALMLASYSANDPGWMVATDQVAHNLLGRLGASVASTLMTVGGLGAWCIPTVQMAWGLRFASHKGADRAVSRMVFAVIAVAMGSVYAATLVPGVSWPHSFGLGGLFVFFSLSLLGMYEIELPSGLANFTSSKEGQGGMVGTIFMALTFTIVSFACVAPFLGGFGGTASGSNLTFLHRLLGGFAFSVTFASPFFLLALFPGLLKKLPKSGNWLNSVKVVMGFLELAAAIKFFRAGELVLFPEPLLFTYDFSMAATIVLALCCGLYLLGFLQLPHDTPSDHTSVPGVVLGCLFLAFGLYLTPALLKLKEDGSRLRPSGVIFAWVDSFLLPEENDDLPFIGDLDRGLEEAKKQNKMVFIDFTGVTCTNCKINEANVFPMKDVRELLKKFVLVQLYTDRVPDKLYSAEERSSFQGSAVQPHPAAQEPL